MKEGGGKAAKRLGRAERTERHFFISEGSLHSAAVLWHHENEWGRNVFSPGFKIVVEFQMAAARRFVTTVSCPIWQSVY